MSCTIFPATSGRAREYQWRMTDARELILERRYDEALEQLLDLYEGKVFRMALAILRDAARAEEVTQDIFLKLWQAFPGYDGRAAPSTWLYTIARNACLSAARAAKYRRTEPLDAVRHAPDASASDAGVEIGQCIERLPAAQRTVISLFYLEDRQVDEVARMLDMPESTVKSHLRRARLALGEMMKE